MRGKKTAIRLMGWMMGIEPTTTGATIRGSTTELHPPQPVKQYACSSMGWMMGIEPTTTGATIRGSTTELHPPLTKAHLITSDWKTNTDTYLIGTPSRTRTRNLRLRRPLLYPVELWAHKKYSEDTNTDEH